MDEEGRRKLDGRNSKLRAAYLPCPNRTATQLRHTVKAEKGDSRCRSHGALPIVSARLVP